MSTGAGGDAEMPSTPILGWHQARRPPPSPRAHERSNPEEEGRPLWPANPPLWASDTRLRPKSARLTALQSRVVSAALCWPEGSWPEGPGSHSAEWLVQETLLKNFQAVSRTWGRTEPGVFPRPAVASGGSRRKADHWPKKNPSTSHPEAATPSEPHSTQAQRRLTTGSGHRDQPRAAAFLPVW